MIDVESIKKTLDSSSGKAIKDFLISNLLELRNIESIDEKDTPTHQSIEVKAQKRAYKKLKDIFEQILTFSGDVSGKKDEDGYEVE